MEKDYINERIELICLAARLILENGGETYRVEETALRMAKGLGLPDVHIAAFPTSLFVEADGHARLMRISHRGNDMKRLARTNDVSRLVEQGKLSFDEAKRLLQAKYRLALAEGLAEGIPAYKNRLLKRRTAETALTGKGADAM